MTLRDRLIVAFLALALVPLALLTLFALDRLERATRLWSAPPVEHALGTAVEVSRTALARMDAAVRAQAESWSMALPDEPIDAARRSAVRAALPATSLDFLQVYREQPGGWRRIEDLAAVGDSAAASPDISDRIAGALAGARVVQADQGALIGVWPAGASRAVAVGYRVPPGFFADIAKVDTGAGFYRRFGVVAEVSRTWLLLLVVGLALALTVTAVVVATRLAADMTRPLRELEGAVERVARGELETRVRPAGARELVTLGVRFNTMTARLAEGRDAVARAEREAAWREIARRLAHEFKNLLTPMTLSMAALERRVTAVDDAERGAVRDSLAAIRHAMDHLDRLAEQFARYARLPEPRLESIDLADVIRSAVTLLPPGRASVELTGDGPLPMRGDPLLLGRAIHNLVLNACEAAGADPAVTVRWSTVDHAAEVDVLDRGAGLAPEVREHLFEPYISTKQRGSGLGLSLVRDIARQHGGTITLADREGGGTRARLRLPLTDSRSLGA